MKTLLKTGKIEQVHRRTNAKIVQVMAFRERKVYRTNRRYMIEAVSLERNSLRSAARILGIRHVTSWIFKLS